MKLVVTSRELRYGGKPLSKGDVFEAHPKDAKLFKLLKKAVDHVPVVHSAPMGHVATTRPVIADPEPAAEPVAETGVEATAPKRRAYKTRALTAED